MGIDEQWWGRDEWSDCGQPLFFSKTTSWDEWLENVLQVCWVKVLAGGTLKLGRLTPFHIRTHIHTRRRPLVPTQPFEHEMGPAPMFV